MMMMMYRGLLFHPRLSTALYHPAMAGETQVNSAPCKDTGLLHHGKIHSNECKTFTLLRSAALWHC
jgi:hypothetical protein